MKKSFLIHITEHHHSVIAGYKLWLGKEPDLKLVGTANHPHKTVKECMAMTQKPDVLILDYLFGEDTIIPYVNELYEACPDAKLMVATGFDMPHIVRRIHAAGIDGIVTKDDGADGFIQCIRSIIAGGVFQSKRIREYLLQEDNLDQVMRSFTPSEKRVLKQLVKGLPDSFIQEELGIAASTLDNHRTKILSKIRVHGFEVYTKAELVGWHNNLFSDLPK